MVPVALRQQHRRLDDAAAFVVFYLLCGLAAALLQVVADPDSAMPMVGASGAISGVMGAYLVLFPARPRLHAGAARLLHHDVALPAWVMLIYWAVLQFVGGFTIGAEGGGVAFWAHVGGFVAGLVLVKVFERPRSPARPPIASLAAGPHRLTVTGIDAGGAALFTGRIDG